MFFRVLFSGLLVFVLGGCASLTKIAPWRPLEKKLIYHPDPFPIELIGSNKVPFEDAWIQSADGTRIHGWFADHPDPIGVALFCHGNAGNVVDRGGTLKILNERHQLAVMVFDYRGFGHSEGSPDEKGILADARAARKWLANRTGVQESEIILMGRSLGGAVAVDLAARDGAKALVLASTFGSMPKVAKNAVPMAPTFLMTQRFNSLKKIKNYEGPLLQSHGDADELIPIAQGRELFDAGTGAKDLRENR